MERDLAGKVVAITGGGGVLCSCMAEALGREGAKVAVIDLNLEAAERVAKGIRDAGGEAAAVAANVLELDSLSAAAEGVAGKLGPTEILINGAGGNKKEATAAPPEMPFFDIPADAVRWVFELNCMGTLLATQVFGKQIVEGGTGSVINISSMCAFTPLTKVVAYSAAKAAVSNFTQWLAVHISQNYSKEIRVNAIAPGFFLTEQNRFLLTNEDSSLTPRGGQIIDHTPMGRFGDPEDLIGTLLWLLSDGAKFVHGIVVPVDGGFSAFSGV